MSAGLEHWAGGELAPGLDDRNRSDFESWQGAELPPTLSGASVLTSTSFNGTLTTAGTLTRKTTKSMAGTLTSSGVGGVLRTAYVVMAGTLTSSGGLVRKAKKALSGILTTAGALVGLRIPKPTPGPPLTLPPRSRSFTVLTRAVLTVAKRVRSFTLRNND